MDDLVFHASTSQSSFTINIFLTDSKVFELYDIIDSSKVCIVSSEEGKTTK